MVKSHVINKLLVSVCTHAVSRKQNATDVALPDDCDSNLESAFTHALPEEESASFMLKHAYVHDINVALSYLEWISS